MTEKKASKKRRGPAPRPAEQQRNHRISIFLTPAEYQLVVDKAGDYPLPDFVRNCAIDGKYAPKIPVSPVIPKLNFEAWKKLSRVANNINQLARHLNAGQHVEVRTALECLAALRLALVDTKPHSKAFAGAQQR